MRVTLYHLKRAFIIEFLKGISLFWPSHKKRKRSFVRITNCIKNRVSTIFNSLNWNTFSSQWFETETCCEAIHVRRLVWFIFLHYSSSKQMYHFHNFQKYDVKIRWGGIVFFLKIFLKYLCWRFASCHLYQSIWYWVLWWITVPRAFERILYEFLISY